MLTDALPMTVPASQTWEDNAGFWIEIIRRHRDRYRTELTDAAVLSAIGDCTGLAVLDAGCGEGYMSRELARRGAAAVHGVDRSARLVTAATAAAVPGTAFASADVAALPMGAATFDLVVANHLLNDLADITGPVRELARVLRPGGRLVALCLHPCFYGHRAEQQITDIGGAGYFTARPVEQTFIVDGLESPAPSVSWIRPLEEYTTAVTGAGLHVTGLTEPHPSAAQLAGSAWWRDNWPQPLFILLTAVKPR